MGANIVVRYRLKPKRSVTMVCVASGACSEDQGDSHPFESGMRGLICTGD